MQVICVFPIRCYLQPEAMETLLNSAMRWLSESVDFASVVIFSVIGDETDLSYYEQSEWIDEQLSLFVDQFINDISEKKYTLGGLKRNRTFAKKLVESNGELIALKKIANNEYSVFYITLFAEIKAESDGWKTIPESFFDHIGSILENNKPVKTAADVFVDSPFNEALKKLNIALFSAKPDFTKLISITASIENIIGFPAQKLLTDINELVNLIDEEFYGDYRNFVKRLTEQQRSSADLKIRTAQGSKYIRILGTISSDKENERIVHGLIINVTDQLRFTRYLQKLERQLNMLIETSGDIIFILDFRGNFMMVNNNGALSLEYTREEMMGKHFLDFVGSSEKPNVAKAFGRLLKSSRLISFEASLTTKYGKTQSFVINARSTFKNEQLDSVLGIATDITSQKEDNKRIDDLNNKLLEASRIILIERDRAKQKITVLEELNKMKSEFVSNISHELRTPLASMIGFAETIDSDPDMPPDMRKEFNQIILNESKRLSKLIDNVLDISKLEGGKIVLEKRKFSITEGLNQVIDRAGKEAKMKSLVFSAELPQEEVYIYADPTRIEQLFENILNNALKFTPQGGRISVFAQSLYNEFEVIISDTGIGIPKDDLPFIFQKFYRVSRKDKNIPGPGLGLSIVKQIIDMHKGMITIRSEEKKGTTVVVKLPIIKQK